MPARPFKGGLIIYKVLVLLLYPEYLGECVEILPNSQYIIKTGPFSRHVHISTSRLKEQLEKLQNQGFIRIVADSRLKVTIEFLRRPMTPDSQEARHA